MKKNRFYRNRKKIDAISRDRNVDVGVASTMLAVESGWENWEKEMDVWMALCRKYMKHRTKTLADLFK